MRDIQKGDRIRYYDVLPEHGQTHHVDYAVDEIYPNGIPSCRQPMVKLDGKPGLVLKSHCFLMLPSHFSEQEKEGS